MEIDFEVQEAEKANGIESTSWEHLHQDGRPRYAYGKVAGEG